QADIVLLEPVLELEVLVPDEFVGDILGDLSSRRGRGVGTDPGGTGRTLIRATVPEAEAVRYAIDLRSMTRGKGSFARKFSHYEELPSHMAAKAVEEVNSRKEGRPGGAPPWPPAGRGRAGLRQRAPQPPAPAGPLPWGATGRRPARLPVHQRGQRAPLAARLP